MGNSKGLRKVLRVHKVFVQINAMEASELHAIGLPEHAPFAAGNNADVKFSWLNAASCVDLGMNQSDVDDAFRQPKRWTIAALEAMMQSAGTPTRDTLSYFSDLLSRANVNTSIWTGSKGTRTVSHLLREVQEGS